MGRRLAIGTAAALLATGGCVALLLHDPVSAPTPLAQPSTTTVASAPTSTATSTTSPVGGRRLLRPTTLSPADTIPAVTAVSTTVASPPPPIDVPIATPTSEQADPACVTARLTVLAIDGCPVAPLVALVGDLTQEAAALPE